MSQQTTIEEAFYELEYVSRQLNGELTALEKRIAENYKALTDRITQLIECCKKKKVNPGIIHNFTQSAQNIPLTGSPNQIINKINEITVIVTNALKRIQAMPNTAAANTFLKNIAGDIKECCDDPVGGISANIPAQPYIHSGPDSQDISMSNPTRNLTSGAAAVDYSGHNQFRRKPTTNVSGFNSGAVDNFPALRRSVYKSNSGAGAGPTNRSERSGKLPGGIGSSSIQNPFKTPERSGFNSGDISDQNLFTQVPTNNNRFQPGTYPAAAAAAPILSLDEVYTNINENDHQYGKIPGNPNTIIHTKANDQSANNIALLKNALNYIGKYNQIFRVNKAQSLNTEQLKLTNLKEALQLIVDKGNMSLGDAYTTLLEKTSDEIKRIVEAKLRESGVNIHGGKRRYKSHRRNSKKKKLTTYKRQYCNGTTRAACKTTQSNKLYNWYTKRGRISRVRKTKKQPYKSS